MGRFGDRIRGAFGQQQSCQQSHYRETRFPRFNRRYRTTGSCTSTSQTTQGWEQSANCPNTGIASAPFQHASQPQAERSSDNARVFRDGLRPNAAAVTPQQGVTQYYYAEGMLYATNGKVVGPMAIDPNAKLKGQTELRSFAVLTSSSSGQWSFHFDSRGATLTNQHGYTVPVRIHMGPPPGTTRTFVQKNVTTSALGASRTHNTIVYKDNSEIAQAEISRDDAMALLNKSRNAIEFSEHGETKLYRVISHTSSEGASAITSAITLRSDDGRSLFRITKDADGGLQFERQAVVPTTSMLCGSGQRIYDSVGWVADPNIRFTAREVAPPPPVVTPPTEAGPTQPTPNQTTPNQTTPNTTPETRPPTVVEPVPPVFTPETPGLQPTPVPPVTSPEITPTPVPPVENRPFTPSEVPGNSDSPLTPTPVPNVEPLTPSAVPPRESSPPLLRPTPVPPEETPALTPSAVPPAQPSLPITPSAVPPLQATPQITPSAVPPVTNIPSNTPTPVPPVRTTPFSPSEVPGGSDTPLTPTPVPEVEPLTPSAVPPRESSPPTLRPTPIPPEETPALTPSAVPPAQPSLPITPSAVPPLEATPPITPSAVPPVSTPGLSPSEVPPVRTEPFTPTPVPSETAPGDASVSAERVSPEREQPELGAQRDTFVDLAFPKKSELSLEWSKYGANLLSDSEKESIS